MQGLLSELDIRSILQLIELGQRTGELYVEVRVSSLGHESLGQDGPRSHSWIVFFLSGQIVYAGETSGDLTRLQECLQGYGQDEPLDQSLASALALFNPPEYAMLWALLEKHVLSPEQGREILHHWVEETLFELLSLHQGLFIFRLGSALNPQLTSFEVSPLLSKITQRIQEWHQLQPHLQSPLQRPVVVASEQLAVLPTHDWLKRLSVWAQGETSITQMARYANRDVLAIAKALHPYVVKGIIQLLPPVRPVWSEPLEPTRRSRPERVPRIVCIDDGRTVRQTIEQVLDTHGYEVTSMANPLKALGLLFQLQPDLLLCDIAMPELEGYQVCAMVRQAICFRDLPIIMLTGKDGFIDRIKARMAGATDYLTKPFGESELVTLVEKYVGPGNPHRSHPEFLLAKEIADILDP